MRVLAKICGLTHRDDVLHADAAGADYLGFVLTPGFGRSIDVDEAARIAAGARAGLVAVLVDEPVAVAAAKARALGAAVLQLHGEESPDQVRELAALGPWTIWKALRAASADDVVAAVGRYAPVVDALLIEGRRVGVTGGGGALLELPPEAVRDALPEGLGFVLAGGLTPETVAAAVARYRPDVVDVSSGVGAGPRRKDPDRVRAFIEAVGAPRTIRS